MGSSIDRTLYREEIPVNLALFFRDYAQRIPVVKNTAFAATPDDYLGSQLIYATWTMVRNISLGVISVFLLVIGIMIMTRKKINPQTVVTVQNALPRIAISIILVFFSYAIGAFLVKLMMPLTNIMPSVVWSAVKNASTTPILDLPTSISAETGMGYFAWGILAATTAFLWNMPGQGPGITLFLLLLLCALILVGFIAILKALLIYVKLLTYIVISPLYFAIGVLPGKESMALDWFKEVVSCVLSVAAMMFMFHFTFAIPVLAIQGVVETGQYINSLVTAWFVPIMMFFSLFTALKMPKKVSGWIKGDPKKR